MSSLLFATDAAPAIEGAATGLLRNLWANAAPVRLLGVGVSGLSPVRQLGLFDFDSLPESQETETAPGVVCVSEDTSPPKVENCTPETTKIDHDAGRQKRLHQALNLIETRFGSDAVHLGARPQKR